MKAIFIPLFFLLSVAYHAQNDNIKLVFSNTSDEAKSEIRTFLLSNPEFVDEFRQIEQSNYIFLSTTQYKKIQDYVTNFKNNDSDKYAEFLQYKQTWFTRYKSTDQLFNDFKQ